MDCHLNFPGTWGLVTVRSAARGLWVVCLLAAVAASGATIQGVRFAESHRAGDLRLTLVGTGLQRYMLAYKVCVAGLYLPPGTAPRRALNDIPKRLEIHYFHRIEAEQFAALTSKGVRRNATPAEFERVAARLATFNAAYQDVRPGDRYSLTYLPGKGCTLERNGRALVTIPGADFAKALYAVWLGEKPVTDGLKAGLLGKG